MPRYTLCPYYIDENKRTISCEDVCRSFDSSDKKWAWMDMYCDSWDWMKCPYAADRAEAYARFEEGEIKALENQENEALRKEIDSLLKKLGRANKKIDRKEELIKSYQRKNEDLYKKWRKADDKLRKQDDKIYGEISALSDIYEQRMCYLIDKFAPNGIVTEAEITEWAKDKEFALVADYEEYQTKAWKVVFKEDEPGENIQEQKPE